MIDLNSVRSATPEELLGHLNDVERAHAPQLLHYIGRRELLGARARVSIVGSREASMAGLRRAARLSQSLVRHGIVVVSGLAQGVDTAAHKACIKAGGDTIAVLGTPLDRVYPRENSQLQAFIAQQHLLVSQFEFGYSTRRWSFPQRNRVMALLSHATVIVEAGESSGTLSQGWEALRLNRPLFIMQSVVRNPTLSWPKKMLEYGACVLAESEDLVETIPASDDLAHAVSAF